MHEQTLTERNEFEELLEINNEFKIKCMSLTVFERISFH